MKKIVFGAIICACFAISVNAKESPSSINSKKDVAITANMAKTRKKPLDIASFFKRRGQQTNPFDVQFHTADDIHFEIIINTPMMPAIISMVPGEARHHIKQISSTNHNTDEIFNSFLTTYKRAPRKLFLICGIKAPFSPSLRSLVDDKQGTLSKVIIELAQTNRGENMTTYFTYNGTTYKLTGKASDENKPQTVDETEKKQYEDLLAEFGVHLGEH